VETVTVYVFDFFPCSWIFLCAYLSCRCPILSLDLHFSSSRSPLEVSLHSYSCFPLVPREGINRKIETFYSLKVNKYQVSHKSVFTRITRFSFVEVFVSGTVTTGGGAGGFFAFCKSSSVA
jgi:hypothetical protein